MTSTEYRDYTRRMRSARKYMESWTPAPGAEARFSWTSCDVCDRPDAAGNRTECVWTAPADDAHPGPWTPANQPAMVCDDCLQFQEYGRLDDASMLELQDAVQRGATLGEWSAVWNVEPVRDSQDAVRVFARDIPAGARCGLFHLADYRVTASLSGPAYALGRIDSAAPAAPVQRSGR